jgi:hypothetical protein
MCYTCIINKHISGGVKSMENKEKTEKITLSLDLSEITYLIYEDEIVIFHNDAVIHIPIVIES